MTGFGLPVDIVKCKISSSLTFGLGTLFEGNSYYGTETFLLS